MYGEVHRHELDDLHREIKRDIEFEMRSLRDEIERLLTDLDRERTARRDAEAQLWEALAGKVDAS